MQKWNHEMEIGSYERGIEWLIQNGYPANISGVWDDDSLSRTYAIDPDSGRKTALARLLVDDLLDGGEAVLIVDEHGIWPSCEHRHIFEHYLVGSAEPKDLSGFPTRIVRAGERGNLIGCVALSLYFCWGVILADRSGMIVRTSHDEWMEMGCSDSDRYEVAKEVMERFGLKSLPRHD